ncbi:glycoside hydrolase family 88/105 protein [Pedobacter rhizosphaerae]|uniref:Unsaturated rhamnogalacturonyl hydrolase n=1 Tax=Pedobacter rhizosphaerae TaxID=390241 RepID=A0A1H9PQF6_9SPHI|nr:glycoside hydrolase family 88 protein [Pedobacter rhizosphaerae]SER50310.1 unsaturated rhamnogalacturonyl hydrolase [Pedobacter rhizosphaerae]
MRKILYLFLLIFLSNLGYTQEIDKLPADKLATEMANTIMVKWPDSLTHQPGATAKWSYDLGVFFEGIANIYAVSHQKHYLAYMQHMMDLFVQPDGSLSRYSLTDYNIDYVKNGRTLLFLYKATKEDKYLKAASLLREQLKTHPRTQEGGFWHKKVYPNQMWLDGIYMGQPFYAEWSASFDEVKNFDDIANQFLIIEKHVRDPKTGLLYHGWDESRQQKWANKFTGNSPNFWGRAMGWYGMALVDVLDYFPKNHAKRRQLEDILVRYAAAIEKVQNPQNSLWYQVLDQADRKGNYPEASASCMFVYTLAKGVRKGYLKRKFEESAVKGFSGIKQHFLEFDKNGMLHLKGTVQVSGLGGTPYRSGTFEYYMSEPVIEDDPKGMGAFILAADQMKYF